MSTPSRADWYSAAVACEVRRIGEGFSKNPRTVRLEDHLLRFQSKEAEVPLSMEDRVARSKSFWRAVMANPQQRPNGESK